ncbi:MAG: phosphatase domain-containing protein [Myxococcota bacterium]|nr:phosphatase domain-containing protein [Myxococcota bacterium]MEE2780129.1 phosphatase domain-containing protein [Myxococcota bacterium]
MDRFRRGGDPSGEEELEEYPLNRSQERDYPEDFRGDIFYWDIDKTYLATEFETLSGLVSTSLEMAADKRSIAGTDVLLRALRRGKRPEEMQSNPIYFVSASPCQLRRVIEEKMLMDGVEFDGITFKDHMGLLRSGRVRQMRYSIPYKLTALLLYRKELPWTVREVLFGDDSESDALIYALYGDVVSGRLRGDDLVRSLQKNDVTDSESERVAELAEGLPAQDIVHRIYINLEMGTAPHNFHPWGSTLVPCQNAFQMALHLCADGLLPAEAACRVGGALIAEHDHRPAGLLHDAVDLVDRGLVTVGWLGTLWPELQDQGLVPPYLALPAERAPDEAPTRRVSMTDYLTPLNHLSVDET